MMPGPTPASGPSAGPFGLDPGETALLAGLVAEAAAPLGIDGAALVRDLGRGSTLGEALRLPAGLQQALYARAHTWFSVGRHDRAEDLFRALCVVDGRSADNWVGYGVCLRLRDRPGEAALAFATAAALRPDWAVAHFHAADAAMARADRPLAARHLEAFAACDGPDTPHGMRQEVTRLRHALARHAPDAPPSAR